MKLNKEAVEQIKIGFVKYDEEYEENNPIDYLNAFIKEERDIIYDVQ